MASHNYQSYWDQYQSQSPRHANISPGGAMSVQGLTYGDYLKNEPMVTEASDAELCKTQEILQMLDNIRPLIEKSRHEVATTKERLASQAKRAMSDISNTTITEQEKEIEELRKKLTEKERENKSVKDEYHTARDELEKSKKGNAKLQQKITELTTEKDSHKSHIDYLSQTNQSLKKQLQKIKIEKSKMEEELNNMKTRLSKVLGNKISDNNPDIADLSDMNRPTKIGERYSELYDNEWTDAFEGFQDHYGDEKKCIKHLLTVLRFAKTHCDDMAEEQKKLITEALYLTKNMHGVGQVDIKKQIKDTRKEAAPCSMQQVQKSFKEDIMRRVSTANSSDNSGATTLFKSDKVQTYMEKCVEICWLMSVQDPPLTFGDVKENEAFDANKYKHYTKTGDRIEFLVWPEMYLKEGALLCKGVAQGAGRAQSARDRPRRNDTTDEKNGRPQTAPPTRDETLPSSYQHQQGYDGLNHQQASHGAIDHMNATSTSMHASRDHITTTAHPTSMKMDYDYNDLKAMYPAGVRNLTWDSFVYYVAKYGINWQCLESVIGAEYHACMRHYNAIFSTETDI